MIKVELSRKCALYNLRNSIRFWWGLDRCTAIVHRYHKANTT